MKKLALCREEGETLSRRNGELEAQVRKMRSAERESEAERGKLAARIASLEDQLATTGEAAHSATREAGLQLEELEAEVLTSCLYPYLLYSKLYA